MDQKDLTKFPYQVPPTLESLPTEVQLQICREMLRSEEPIVLTPWKPYISGIAFGSLGILRASKYFFNMALSIMYGENCFHLTSEDRYIVKRSFEDYGEFSVHIETLRQSPWENLRKIPHTECGKVVSSLHCLEMISQTSSGQTFLKQLQFGSDFVRGARTMDGVLFFILRRMRGLQSVNLELVYSWEHDEDLNPDGPVEDQFKREGEDARNFLLLIKEELSHIKKVTIEWSGGFVLDHPAIANWMVHELKKRNEAWTPPLPSYKEFRRTVSPMSIVDAEVAKPVVQLDDEFRSKDYEQRLAHLESVYGVF